MKNLTFPIMSFLSTRCSLRQTNARTGAKIQYLKPRKPRETSRRLLVNHNETQRAECSGSSLTVTSAAATRGPLSGVWTSLETGQIPAAGHFCPKKGKVSNIRNSKCFSLRVQSAVQGGIYTFSTRFVFEGEVRVPALGPHLGPCIRHRSTHSRGHTHTQTQTGKHIFIPQSQPTRGPPWS